MQSVLLLLADYRFGSFDFTDVPCKGGRMNNTLKSILFWTPRALMTLFALFLVVFSFDVFGNGEPFWTVVAGFLIHNIPTFVLLLVIWLTWRREWIGGVIFVLLGLAYIVLTLGKVHISAQIIIGGLPILIGLLYLLNWIYRAELRPPVE